MAIREKARRACETKRKVWIKGDHPLLIAGDVYQIRICNNNGGINIQSDTDSFWIGYGCIYAIDFVDEAVTGDPALENAYAQLLSRVAALEGKAKIAEETVAGLLHVLDSQEKANAPIVHCRVTKCAERDWDACIASPQNDIAKETPVTTSCTQTQCDSYNGCTAPSRMYCTGHRTTIDIAKERWNTHPKSGNGVYGIDCADLRLVDKLDATDEQMILMAVAPELLDVLEQYDKEMGKIGITLDTDFADIVQDVINKARGT